MELHLPYPIPEKGNFQILPTDHILLVGSCFSENIYKKLSRLKFQTLTNPHGILYTPLSIATSLKTVLSKKVYCDKDLFDQNEIWHHWDFHSAFSDYSKENAVKKMNESVAGANAFLRSADVLIITPGTAFQYYFLDNEKKIPVANCHKVPGSFFKKQLLEISEMTTALQVAIDSLKTENEKLKIIFTVSPVRHIRDGIIENNRSKARLLEATHRLVEQNDNCFYFPAYEILMDVLRDYRFYEADWVHPNQLAVNLIWEQFCRFFFSETTTTILEEIEKIVCACEHRPLFPLSKAHQTFVRQTLQQIDRLSERFPFLDFQHEISCLNAAKNP